MTANAEIVLEEHPDSLIIPEAAITYDAKRNPFVEILDPPAKTGRKKVPIKIGVGNGTRTQVINRAEGGRQDHPPRCCSVTLSAEAFIQTIAQPAREQAAQLPHDVRHPVGHRLGRHPVARRARDSARATGTCCASSGKNIGIIWGAARACRLAASAPDATCSSPPPMRPPSQAESRLVAVVNPELQRSGREGEEPLQLRVARRSRHRAAVSGHPLARSRVRPPVELGRRAAARRVAHRR